MSKPKSEAKRIRSQLIEVASKMPELSHWPDRSVPFDFKNSQVVKWLKSQPGIDKWMFDKARHSGAIVFDSEKEVWKGVLPESLPSAC